MKTLLIVTSLIGSISSYAGDVISFDTPRINSHAISAKSDPNAVCRALAGENSSFIPHAFRRSGKVTQGRNGCLSTISKAYVVQIDKNDMRTEGSIWHMGKRWISKIKCLKP